MTRHKYALDYSISFHKVNPDDQSLLDQFRCEYKAICDFIQNHSIDSQKDVSYIFVDDENQRIIAFCAICCTGISTTAYESGVEYTTSIPAVEIDYFAVDEEYRSLLLDAESSRYETLSRALFLYMQDVIRSISEEHVGATHICLYAVPKAVSFYKRCGFTEFNEYMNGDEVPFLEGCVPMFCVIDK